MRWYWIALALAWGLALSVAGRAADFQWQLRKGFRPPATPADNPMSAAKVELGRHLFYDKRLSGNGTQSCASCNKQELAFTAGKARAEGSTGPLHSRSSLSLVHVGYFPALTWVSATLDSLEEQALVPMFGTDPVELGLKGREEALLRRIEAEPIYQRLFPEAFRGEGPSVQNIAKSLAAFQRSIISVRSPYDRYRYDGEEAALSEAAKRGEKVFFSSEKAGCFQCHGGWTFAGPLRFEGGAKTLAELHDTGLGGEFRAPTLRNIAVTAPYMHDGRMATLEEAVEHYNEGGRGKAKSPILRKLGLTAAEKADLIAFLHSLTDEELLRDRRWSDPWKR